MTLNQSSYLPNLQKIVKNYGMDTPELELSTDEVLVLSQILPRDRVTMTRLIDILEISMRRVRLALQSLVDKQILIKYKVLGDLRANYFSINDLLTLQDN